MAKKITVEKGMTFTRWTVIGDIDECIYTPAGARKWKCRCECESKTETFVLENSLIYGSSKSCGCLRKENSKGKANQDLVGSTFGELTVLERTAQYKNGHCLWLCQCSCGNTTLATTNRLNSGQKKSCGCIRKKNVGGVLRKDITNQKFGYFTAIAPTEKRDPKRAVIWRCKCECGNEIEVSYQVLTHTKDISCGCIEKENKPVREYVTRIAGTSINAIHSKKIPTDNTSGHKGVSFINGKYHAKIGFQQKQYHIGSYERIEDAVQARQEAEKDLFEEAANFYQRWQERADADPAWAEANPIVFSVQKIRRGKLQLICLPVLE